MKVKHKNQMKLKLQQQLNNFLILKNQNNPLCYVCILIEALASYMLMQ